mmetsp:Transcript_15214/g.30304  ORF Transcript_15214/g.30304 Transcript_15214/m.30304 type:complete len:240 (-) Transcript_15214:107-826(-)
MVMNVIAESHNHIDGILPLFWGVDMRVKDRQREVSHQRRHFAGDKARFTQFKRGLAAKRHGWRATHTALGIRKFLQKDTGKGIVRLIGKVDRENDRAAICLWKDKHALHRSPFDLDWAHASCTVVAQGIKALVQWRTQQIALQLCTLLDHVFSRATEAIRVELEGKVEALLCRWLRHTGVQLIKHHLCAYGLQIVQAAHRNRQADAVAVFGINRETVHHIVEICQANVHRLQRASRAIG